jgi:hypothetical protein
MKYKSEEGMGGGGGGWHLNEFKKCKNGGTLIKKKLNFPHI